METSSVHLHLETLPGNTEYKNQREIEPKKETMQDESSQGKGMNLIYRMDETPPISYTILLGFQQYLTMFSSTMSIPYLLAPAMCIGEDHPARAYLISTILFVSGITTFLQVTFGIRLPIIQGGPFSFLIPVFGILNLPQWKCPSSSTSLNSVDNGTSGIIEAYDDEIWMSRMREIQGAITVSALFQIFLGLTGAVGIILHYVTPLTIAPTITLVGISLFTEAANLASGQWGLAAGYFVFSTAILLTVLSQYMENLQMPVPIYKRRIGWKLARISLFAMFPVLITIIIMWSLSAVLTVSGVFPEGSPARTDQKIRLLNDSPWFRVPYPFQWGLPTVSTAGVLGMFAGIIASVVESIGDYYACARLCDAPTPPPHAINRGICVEGIGCIISGVFGSGTGTTSYSENIAVIGITRVASRRVILAAAMLMIIFGGITKFGALFVSMPSPIVGGIFFVTFGMITAVGLSNVQYVNLNSTRNMFVLGFSIFSGLAISKWTSHNRTVIQTGSVLVDQLITVILSTSMLIGGLIGFVLDNTMPGSDEDRGLTKWRTKSSECNTGQEETAYDLPFGTNFIRKCAIFNLIPICPTFKHRSWNNICPCKRKAVSEVASANVATYKGEDNPSFDVSQL